jgi:hypothetical protein
MEDHLQKTRKSKTKKEDPSTMPDNYGEELLHIRLKWFIDGLNMIRDGIKKGVFPLRQSNIPEDISENTVKFIVRNHDGDASCKWAKNVGLPGDLYSDKYPVNSPPEVKAFMSDGPSSFGPKKKFGVMYFLDARELLADKITLWKLNLTNDSPEWKQLKMNKTQTFEDQCNQGRRPHISWDSIHKQINEKCPDKCVKVYEGSFEGIFIPKVAESTA